jgi:hypothetical protein
MPDLMVLTSYQQLADIFRRCGSDRNLEYEAVLKAPVRNMNIIRRRLTSIHAHGNKAEKRNLT